jgi:hypothetical protein
VGEIAGAGLLSHVPTIMLPPDERLSLNEGKEISLVPGLERLRAEVFESLDYDTVLVLDSHWCTTVEFVVAAQEVRAGLFTSDELPRGMSRVPYDWRGDPSLARAIAGRGERHGTWITAIDDPWLPVYYATVNLWSYLGRGLDRRWVTARPSRPATGGCCCWPPARCRTRSGRCANCARTRPATPCTSGRPPRGKPTWSASAGCAPATTQG